MLTYPPSSNPGYVTTSYYQAALDILPTSLNLKQTARFVLEKVEPYRIEKPGAIVDQSAYRPDEFRSNT